jgi:hypothetical protein
MTNPSSGIRVVPFYWHPARGIRMQMAARLSNFALQRIAKYCNAERMNLGMCGKSDTFAARQV